MAAWHKLNKKSLPPLGGPRFLLLRGYREKGGGVLCVAHRDEYGIRYVGGEGGWKYLPDEEYRSSVWQPVELPGEPMAHLLSQDEMQQVPEGALVWIEQHCSEKDYLMPMAATGDGRFGNFYLGLLWRDVDRRHYRAWDNKPADKQREAEPWN